MKTLRRTLRRLVSASAKAVGFGFFLWLYAGTQAIAQENAYSAESVKAAYLYHFAGYVQWPDTARTRPLVIGVMGDRAVVAELERILPGRNIQGRALQVREFQVADDLSSVQILYVGSDSAAAMPALVTQARRHHILLVSESASGLDQGSTINFVNVANRIRFEISLRAADETGIKISSRLLAAALKLKRSYWMAPNIVVVHATPQPRRQDTTTACV